MAAIRRLKITASDNPRIRGFNAWFAESIPEVNNRKIATTMAGAMVSIPCDGYAGVSIRARIKKLIENLQLDFNQEERKKKSSRTKKNAPPT